MRRILGKLGFRESVTAPCVYYNETSEVRLVTHVDDFLCVGPQGALRDFYNELREILDLKCVVLGPGREESQEGTFLGRTIQWHDWGIAWRGDRKILDDMLVEWGMERSSVVSTPSVKEECSKAGEGGETLIRDEARVTRFRRGAAKLNYMALDDPRISYAFKQISQVMSKPTEEGEVCIKRVLRFLRGRPECEWRFPWQEMPTHLVGYSDSDWAGCLKLGEALVEGGSLWANTS